MLRAFHSTLLLVTSFYSSLTS